MATEKADVDLATLAPEEIDRVVQAFGLKLDAAHKLCGGYSSVNYRICQTIPDCSDYQTGADSVLLRVAVGLPLAAAERQNRVLCAVAKSGVPCPQIIATLTGQYVLPCQTESNQTAFAMVHSWVEGVTANKRAEEDEAGMMRRLGQLLAKLHSCEPTECGLLDASSDEYMCVCSLCAGVFTGGVILVHE